jgi:Superfamily I DNA and RNA helicases
MDSRFNDEQLAFIKCEDPRILLYATAGSGKTRCCVGYCSWNIEHGVAPEQILMVTFTRKAAAEFSERLAHATGIPPTRFTAGTFHSICHALIREEPRAFGLRSRFFSVLDERQSNKLIRQISRDIGLPNEIGGRKVPDLVSIARNTLFLPPEVRDAQDLVVPFQSLITRYRGELDDRNSTDYDGLLEKVSARMFAQPQYAENLRDRWRRVIVDEMQDCNALNYQFLSLLNPERLVCVGDSNQSIYEWRGANNRLIDEFVKHQSATVLTMRTNYRSGQKILDAANVVLRDTDRPIAMRSGVGSGGLVYGFRHDDDIAEADRVANWITKVLEKGWKPKDIAVLSRTARALRRVETALKSRNIDYRSYHGRTVAESPHIRDATSLIRAAFNHADTFAIEHVAGFFPSYSPALITRVSECPRLIPKLTPELHLLLESVRHTPPSVLFEQLPEILAPVFQRKYKKDHDKRVIDLRAICTQMASSTKDEFLDAFQIEERIDPIHPETCVTLSTVHSAKGLEWPFVWVVDASDQAFGNRPHTKERLPANEPQRLFYVAITRAKEQLILSCPAFAMGSKREPCDYLAGHLDWAFDHEQDARGRVIAERGAYRLRNPLMLQKTKPQGAEREG